MSVLAEAEGRPDTIWAVFRRLDLIEDACLVAIAALVAVALFGRLIAPYNPDSLDLQHVLSGPSRIHSLGTDALGRDVLSRLLVGARTSMLGATLVVFVATLAGTAIALATAWRGGWLDSVTRSTLDLLMSFPALLLAFLAVAVFGPGLTAPVIASGVFFSPYFAKIILSAAIRERNLPYVAAGSVLGFSGWTLALRRILPNIMSLIVVQAAATFGYAMINLSALSFLGLGVQPPTADWGVMVASGQQGLLTGHPEESLFASIAILAAVLSFTLLGQRLSSRVTGSE